MLIQDKLKKSLWNIITVYIKFKIQAANNRIVDFKYNKHKANIKLSIVTNVRHMRILHKFLVKGRYISVQYQNILQSEGEIKSSKTQPFH